MEKPRKYMSKLEKLYTDFNNEQIPYKKKQLGEKLVMEKRRVFGLSKEELEEE